MQQVTVRKLKKGEYFKRKADSAKVYTRGEYYKDVKRFNCTDHADAWGNGIDLKGSTLVFVGFTY